MTEENNIEKLTETAKALADFAVDLPEAGGVAYLDLHGTFADNAGNLQPIKLSLTSRGKSPVLALIQLMEAAEFARDEYNLYPFPVRVTSLPREKSVDEAFPINPTGVPQRTQATMSESFGQDIIGTLHVKTMVVTPRDDGKAKVEFFEDGHKWADIAMTMAPDQLAGKLSQTADWTPSHFIVPGRFQVDYLIDWKNSTNLNSNGNPYKNVVNIKKSA